MFEYTKVEGVSRVFVVLRFCSTRSSMITQQHSNEGTNAPTAPTSLSISTVFPSTLPSHTGEVKNQKRKREEEEMCEPETIAPPPPPRSPSPSHSQPKFQLHPRTPESDPNLAERMKRSTCFRCGQLGHWAPYCPNPPNNNNNNNKSLSFSPNQKNHSPISFKLIQCRCGHGFCEVRTARNDRNWGRQYFVCPIKRGARCKDHFIKWCDDPIDESELQPPLLKYPQCECGAGVCRKLKETDGTNRVKYYFACPIKQDHGSCGYRVSEDELLKNISIVPIQHSRQKSLHEFWESCQNNTTVNDLGNDLGEGGDLLLTTKRMRITGNSENPSPVAVFEIPEGKDGESPIEAANSKHVAFPVFEFADDDVDFSDSEAWEALEAIEAEASVPSHLSTPSSIHHRQSLFQSDIGSCPVGWLGRLIFFHPTQSLKFPQPQPFFCCIFPSFDSIVVPQQVNTPNGDLTVNSVGKHVQFSTINPVVASQDVISPNKSPMSKAQRLREVALFTQQQLLNDLDNLDPHQHESMREAAEETFAMLNRLGIECKQFSDHIWNFINLASSMTEIDKSMENSPTLEEYNKFLEEEKVRLSHIQDDYIKTEALLEASNKQRKLLCENISKLEAMLHAKQNELKSFELEMITVENRLSDLTRSRSEVDILLKDRIKQAEVARERSTKRYAKQIAAKEALEKAKLVLEN